MKIIYQNLVNFVLDKFADIILSANFIGGTFSDPNKLRLHLVEGSFLDSWLSEDGDYAYHWERRS